LWGTHKGDFRGLAPTGRSVEFTAMYFYRFDGGKVVEIHAMVNLLKILQQLGAVPSLK
jgi:predicted ester cyclase